jgi:hypothetical protein
LGILWGFHEVSLIFYGGSMIFLWDFNWIPVGFPWYVHDISVKSCHWKAMYHLTKVEHVFIPFATDVAQGTHVASCSETGARVWNPSQLISW